MELLLDTYGLYLSKWEGAFLIQNDKIKKKVSPYQITGIAITKACRISSEAILLAVEHEIPIIFYDKQERPKARIWSSNYKTIAILRRRQILFAHHKSNYIWVKDTLKSKILSQINNLKKLELKKGVLKFHIPKSINQMTTIYESIGDALLLAEYDVLNSLRGKEGAASSIYWNTVRESLSKILKIGNRRERPAKDFFNALLNYYYGMLYNKIEGAIISVGLDPYMAYMHSDEYNQPTLAYDLIEPFRPWADFMLIELCIKGMLESSCFNKLPDGNIVMNTQAKRQFIMLFNSFMHQKELCGGKMLKRKSIIRKSTMELARLITKTMSNE